MPVNAYSIFSKGWFAGEKLCIFAAAFRYIAIYVDWMIVALIAFSKCIHLFKPRLGKMVFSGLSGHFKFRIPLLRLKYIYLKKFPNIYITFSFLQRREWLKLSINFQQIQSIQE